MQIDVVYIIVFLAGFIAGGVLVWLLLSRYYKAAWLRNVIAVKNPELWDLAHFYIKDEEETGRHRRKKPKESRNS